MTRVKRMYVLSIRPDDQSPWSEATYYESKRERDADERYNRILGGYRTRSWQESTREARLRIEAESVEPETSVAHQNENHSLIG